jgi:hypothetical protein
MKTDWMMHEFRLPSLAEPPPPKKLLDKSLPPNVMTLCILQYCVLNSNYMFIFISMIKEKCL